MSPQKKQIADSINNIVLSFKKSPNILSLDSLKRILRDTAVKSLLPAQIMKVYLDSIGSTDTATTTTLAAVKDKLDTINTAKDSGATSDNVCPKLIKVSIKFLFGDNSQYIGVIEDTTGNALSTFIIAQLDKELFYNKLKEALSSLCDNIDSVTSKVSFFRAEDPDLYTKFLEAKEDFANTNGLAGTLKIFKYVVVHYEDDDAPKNTGEIPLNKSLTEDFAYPDIKSIKKAKKLSQKSYNEAVKLRHDLDSLSSLANAVAKSPGDKYIAARMATLAKNVDTTVELAKAFRDSINSKIPDEQILDLYNKAIRVSRKAASQAKKAMDMLQKGTRSIGSISTAVPPSQHWGHISDEFIESLNDSALVIHEIQIQFQDGFIENIKIFGKMSGNDHMFRFENTYPIAFSTKRDFKRLIDIKLEERSNYKLFGKNYLTLGEVITYNENLANNNKDYSPANQVLTIKALSDTIKEVALYKDQTSKILEMQVFSDLKGADNNNPNGLIQLELNKRLNFFSRRTNISWQFLHKKEKKKAYESFANFGLFNFVTPEFTIDKVEENQKRLILDHIDTLTLAADTSRPLTYTSSINLYKHQIYSIGLDISCFLFDAPNIKSTFNFGMGFHFGRSAIQDTLKQRDKSAEILFTAAPNNNVLQYGVNTFRYGPFVTAQIFPDSRFGFSLTQRFNWYKAYSSNFVQVRDSADYLRFIAKTPKDKIATTPYSTSKCLGTTEIFAYFSPNGDGSNKLFFRYRFNWDVTNGRENFHQMQVGFSTYLTATKEFDKLKKAANLP